MLGLYGITCAGDSQAHVGKEKLTTCDTVYNGNIDTTVSESGFWNTFL